MYQSEPRIETERVVKQKIGEWERWSKNRDLTLSFGFSFTNEKAQDPKKLTSLHLEKL